MAKTYFSPSSTWVYPVRNGPDIIMHTIDFATSSKFQWKLPVMWIDCFRTLMWIDCFRTQLILRHPQNSNEFFFANNMKISCHIPVMWIDYLSILVYILHFLFIKEGRRNMQKITARKQRKQSNCQMLIQIISLSN